MAEKPVSKKQKKIDALTKNLRENLLRRKQKVRNLKTQEKKDD